MKSIRYQKCRKQRSLLKLTLALAVIGSFTLTGCKTVSDIANSKSYTSEKLTIPSFEIADNSNIDYTSGNTVYQANDRPLSTLRTWVSTNSYGNLRRAVMNNYLPSQDSVRAEEWLNYFDYQHVAPKGKVPFYVTTEIGPAPWNKLNHLIHIGVKGIEKLNETTPINTIFIIELSPAMKNSAGFPLVSDVLTQFNSNINQNDSFSIISYSGQPQAYISQQGKVENRQFERDVNKMIAATTQNQPTSLLKGLTSAYEYATKNFVRGANNRIIFVSTGQFRLSQQDFIPISNLIEQQRKAGFSFSTLIFSPDVYNYSAMQTIADIGGGFHAFIDTKNEVNRIVTEKLITTPSSQSIANKLRLAVSFNPKLVDRYRLLGFEARDSKNLLKSASLTDEILPGYSYTAVYEVALKPPSPPEAAKVVIGARPTAETIPDEIGAVILEYRLPSESYSNVIKAAFTSSQIKKSLDKTSGNFNFAASVAALALKMNKDIYLDDVSLADIHTLSLMRDSNSDNSGRKAEFSRIIEQLITLTGK